MTLASGTLLTHYRIVDALGAGAMGQVYRAIDTRLEREVAIKVLPGHFAVEPERLRRFEREAKALASLNHPNIAQIYGVDQEGELYFLALELVRGETLEQRLRRGPLPLGEALQVAGQIAEGLEAAHEAGVIHRDLKPANICVGEDGRVKLLDFGLAKPAREAGGTGASADSVHSTEEGRLLGTPTYMAPEQARGKAIDKRVDVWAFGCVLYECLSGRRAFAGETLTDVLSAVIGSEPDWMLVGNLPPRLQALLARCLAKDVRKRLRDVGDARLELEAAMASESEGFPVSERVPGRPAAVLGGAALVLGLGLGSAATWLALQGGGERTGPDGTPRSSRLARVSIPIPSSSSRLFPRVAPDGSAIAYAAPVGAGDEGGRETLYLRRLDAPEPIRLPGVEDPRTLAFAPDARSLAVVVGSSDTPGDLRLVRVLLDQGAPRTVPLGTYAPNANITSGMAWADGNLLVTASNDSELLSRPVEGGTWKATPLAQLDSLNPYGIEVFRALPGGRHVLANTFVYGAAGFEPRSLAIDVSSGVATTIAEGGHPALLASGELLFTRGDALYGAEFDSGALRLVGTPRLLLEGLRTIETWQPAWFDVALDGTIIHSPGGRQGAERELLTSGREGTPTPWIAQARAYDGALSIDRAGTFVVVSVLSTGGLVETWGSDAHAPLLRPLVAVPRADILPGALDGPGRRLYFARMAHDDSSGIWRASLDEPERQERMGPPTPPGSVLWPTDVSPDGRWLLVFYQSGSESRIVEWSLDTPSIEERILCDADARTQLDGYSPDGQWIAYTDTRGGRRSAILRRRRSDGTVGPPIPVPGLDDRSIGIVHWINSPQDQTPTLLVSDEHTRILSAIELSSADPPTFSAPGAWSAKFDRPILAFDSFPDGRALVVLRGAAEGTVDRVEVVLGGSALLWR